MTNKLDNFLRASNDDLKFEKEFITYDNETITNYKINNITYIKFKTDESINVLWHDDDISKELVAYLMNVFDNISVIKA